jgi:glycosyltransferase involved in cell wall biosynthesis
MLAPVALFTYKRPDHTQATLDALALNTLAAQTHLYVFSDGAKHDSDSVAVRSVRNLVRGVSGFASVTLVERGNNLGLATSIISGVTELLDQHDSIIVLEDDLVTSENFLAFMNESLVHYRNDPCAFSVTGHTFPEEFLPIPNDYPFDTYAGYRCSSWSWGTWRDRWQRVDWDMRYFSAFCADQHAQFAFNRGGQDMTAMLRLQHEGEIDSWAIRFCHAHCANEMRCIYPTRTLVINIGLDNSGTHSGPNPRFSHRSLDESWQPKAFCPARETEPRIAASFRAIFDPPPMSFAQLVRHKTKRFGDLVRRMASEVGSTIESLFTPSVQAVGVLIINTNHKHGGAARAAYRAFCGIRERYSNARYLTLFKEDCEPGVIGVLRKSVKGLIAQRLVALDQIPLRAYPRRQKSFFSPAVHANFLRARLSRFRPELAHLHWVGNSLLRVEEIARLSCPVVWTLHDTWAFTGGCHYTGTCEGYQQQCGNCPQLGSARSDDLSRSLMQRKARAYAELNLTIVTPSRWLGDLASKSSLFAGRRIEVIPNGLDTTTFKPIDQRTARDNLGISNDHPVILFGTQALSDPRKGGDLLCEALALLQTPCTLLTFGEGALPLGNAPLVTVRSLGNLTDDAGLAMSYSAADVFACPSREDNLPNTVAEALACGTPCVAFDINGLPDMIEHKKTGWLAKAFDPVELAEGMKWLMTHACSDQLRNAAREKAVAEYSMEVMTERYARLYAELLEPHKGRVELFGSARIGARDSD